MSSMTSRFLGWMRSVILTSQRYTKTDMLYAARGGFWLVGSSVFGATVAFLVAVILGNALPREGYGVYKYVLAVMGLLGAFSLTGIGEALTRAYAEGKKGLLKPAFVKTLLWHLPAVLIALGASAYYHLKGNPFLSISMLAVALFSPLMAAFSTYNPYLFGKKLFRKQAIFNTARLVLPSLALVLVVLFTKDPSRLVIAFLFVQTLTLAVLFWATRRSIPKAETPDSVAPVITYAKHLSVMAILGSVAQHADKILIFHFLGSAETAIFAFAIAMPEMLRGFIKHLYTLALPKFTENDPERSLNAMGRKIVIITASLLLVAAIYAAAAPLIYRFIFPQYLASIPYSQVLALTIVFTGLGILPSAWLTSQAKVKKKYAIASFSPLLRLVLMLALVVPLGIWGIVIAIVVSKGLSSILTLTLAFLRKPHLQASG